MSLLPNGNLRQANLKMLFEKAKQYEKASFKGLFNFINFIDKVKTSSGDMASAKIIGENDDVIRIMSIHKSKGLEFPIVFLCNSSKKFNLRDMSEKIVLDNNLGIGANYIKDGIEFPTLAKDAIKIKANKEAISEEMRVLYVALTRAKEKLIIVGTSDNVEKKLQEKVDEISKYYKFTKPEKLNPRLVEKYKSYLDWLELVYKYNDSSCMKLNIVNKSELLKENNNEEQIEIRKHKEEIISEIRNHKINMEEYEKIDKMLNYTYKYAKDIELPTKTSVTALKEFENLKSYNESKENKNNKKIKNENSKIKVPSFAIDKEIKGARKGTIIHLILSKITNEKTIDEVNNLIEKLISKNIITEEEKDAIDMKLIENYLASKLFKDILDAKEVKRETPFYLNINSNELFEGTNEPILVQGVIDIYYISKEDKLILVDYKTDYVKEEKELVERYKSQLDLYKRALEKALNRKVDKECIYSTYLNKCIEM